MASAMSNARWLTLSQVVRIALQKADALGILARANQVVTKIGVIALTQHIDFHQPTTNKMNRK